MLALDRYLPSTLREMNRSVEHFLSRVFGADGGTFVWTPGVEAFARDKEYVIRCDIPGIDPKDVSVKVEGRMLTITGERKAGEAVEDQRYWLRGITYGRFEQCVALPDDVDPEQVKATYRHGVLEITIPLPVTKHSIPVTVEVQPALESR
jgi:HSP20 family protein